VHGAVKLRYCRIQLMMHTKNPHSDGDLSLKRPPQDIPQYFQDYAWLEKVNPW
jgi:hypothetical protein